MCLTSLIDLRDESPHSFADYRCRNGETWKFKRENPISRQDRRTLEAMAMKEKEPRGCEVSSEVWQADH